MKEVTKLNKVWVTESTKNRKTGLRENKVTFILIS